MTYKEKMLKWADALESGKYKQHRGGWGQLYSENNVLQCEGYFCCLNVANEVLGDGPLGIAKGGNSTGWARSVAAMFGQEIDWCGQFIAMNDEDGMTFPQIAAEIRKRVK